MLPWQERSLLCQMFATCSYPEKGLVQDSRPLWLICVKIFTFSLPWKPGRSDVNANDTSKLLDLENPLFGATFMALCVILAELWLILC